MADTIKKTIKLDVDTSAVNKKTSSIVDKFVKSFEKGSFTALEKPLKEAVKIADDSSKKITQTLYNDVVRLNKLMNQSALAKAAGKKSDSEMFEKAISTVRGKIDANKLMQSIYASINTEDAVKSKDDSKKTKGKARAGESAYMSFAGIGSQISEIENIRSAIESGKLTDIDTGALSAVLDKRQKMIEELGQKQAKLKAMDILGMNGKDKKNLQKDIQALRESLGLSEKKSDTAKKNIGNAFSKLMMNAIRKISSYFVNTFKNAFNEMAKMASYDAGSTLISNSAARRQQLMFGLTGSQNYAMSKAMGILGMQSIEDLMWANSAQRAEYNRLTEIFQRQYESLQSSGILQGAQKFQIDLAVLKSQFQNTIYKFIAAHSDTILGFLNGAMEFMSSVLEFFGGIADTLGFIFGTNGYSTVSSAASSTSNAVSNNTTNNTDNSKLVNLTVNYSDNGADKANIISESILDKISVVLNG